MIKRVKGLFLASAVAAAVVAAGCGQGPGSPASADRYNVLSENGPLSGSFAGGHGQRAFFKGIDLTDAQKAQFKAIGEKYKGQMRSGDWKTQREALKAILLADTVDGAKLKAFIQDRLAQGESKRDSHFAMMSEMRAVLTDAQREKVASKLEAPAREKKAGKGDFGGMRKMMRDRMLADLNLTDAQKAALDQLEAKMTALHEGAQPAQMRTAFASFVRTGDTAGLKAVQKPQLPIDELVAVATSLDKAQREKLLSKFERFGQHRGGKGRHERHH